MTRPPHRWPVPALRAALGVLLLATALTGPGCEPDAAGPALDGAAPSPPCPAGRCAPSPVPSSPAAPPVDATPWRGVTNLALAPPQAALRGGVRGALAPATRADAAPPPAAPPPAPLRLGPDPELWLGDVGLRVALPGHWLVEHACDEGWRLQRLASADDAALAPADLLLSLTTGPQPHARAFIEQGAPALVAGWRERGYTVERADVAGRGEPQPALTLLLRTPELRALGVLYLPADARMIIASVETSPALALDAQAILTSARERGQPLAPVERCAAGARRSTALGLTWRPITGWQRVPLFDPSRRVVWLGARATQLEVTRLDEAPLGSSRHLERRARMLIAAALEQWPDATPVQLLRGHLGPRPAVRFTLRRDQVRGPGALGAPLPELSDAPSTWWVAAVLTVDRRGAPLLLRLWAPGDDGGAVERQLEALLSQVALD